MENEYYGAASTPTEDYLAHYGIKGMKWGVRKAIASGNAKALGRQYRKAQKKLAKLEKRASSGKKYAKRAALLGAGAAAAGGLAAAGTQGVGTGIRKLGGLAGRASSSVGNALMASKNKKLHNIGYTLNKGGAAANSGLVKAGLSTEKWGNNNSIGKALQTAGRNVSNNDTTGIVRAVNKGLTKTGHQQLVGQTDKLAKVSNNTFARIGAGAIGAGLAGAAGYNAYRAATTKRAAKKAAAFRAEMNKQFAGTKYANAPRTPQKKRKRG